MHEELPPYDSSSPLPGYITARDLAPPTDAISLLSARSQAAEYSYKSDHLHIKLGPRRWGTRFPVYGFQGVVEGTVQFAKKCTHVVSVVATVGIPWSQPLSYPASDALNHPNSFKGKWRSPLPTAETLPLLLMK